VAYDLVQLFARMLRSRTGELLDAWLARVESSKLPELQSFASGIEKDKDAVRNGLTWSINNGMVEGHVTKLKLIKRQGYGRAGFPLLRKWVLHALSPVFSSLLHCPLLLPTTRELTALTCSCSARPSH